MNTSILSKVRGYFSNTRYLTLSASIAALYAALTLLPGLNSLVYGPIQVRLSEILTVLPYFTPAAIPGLFIGCMLANFASPYFLIDIFVGSAVTLSAAILSRYIPRIVEKRLKKVAGENKLIAKIFVPMAPVILNGLYVAALTKYIAPMNPASAFVAQTPFWMVFLFVAGGEFIACYVLGIIFMNALKRVEKYLK